MIVDLDLDLNPRVKELLETAVALAKPIWVGILSGDQEGFPRVSTYLEPADGFYINTDDLWWRSSVNVVIDRCLLAKGPNEQPVSIGPLDTPRALAPNDSLVMLRGALRFFGRLP